MAHDDEAGGTVSAAGPEPGARPEDEPGAGVMVAFGRQLRLLRMRTGLDRTEFGNRVGYAAQSVASFEQGRRIPQPGFIDQADPVLDAGGLLLALKEECSCSSLRNHPVAGSHTTRVPALRREAAGRAMKTINAGAAQELSWFKSSYSGAEGGECLEVASMPTRVLVRDAKQVQGPIVALSPEAWAAFVRRPAG